MKPIESPPISLPSSDSVVGKVAAKPDQEEAEVSESEEQAFYAAQKEAFDHLRAYHSNRPRRKR